MGDTVKTGSFMIGKWTVNPALDRIESRRRTIAIKPRAMDLLVHLANHAGQVVSSDELARVVWHDTVITDSAVYQNVTQLRRAFGDDAQNPRYIETIPKKGYRLIAKIFFLESDGPSIGYFSPDLHTPSKMSSRLRYVLAGLFVIVTSDYSGLMQSESTTASASATTGGVPSTIGSIAVLPFVDMSPDEDQSYLGEGISEELLHTLSNIPNLRVAGRTSAFTFTDNIADIGTIGEKLNVDAVLEGSVWRVDDELRVTARLADAASGNYLWSKSFDREFNDLMAIQTEIAQAVTDTLSGELPEKSAARMAKTPTQNIDAYDYYLLGRHHLYKRTPSSVIRAVDLFQQAIGADPDFALAYAGLSHAYFFQRLFTRDGGYDPELNISAEIAARHALEMDDQLAEAHVAMANVRQLKKDWPGAESAYRRATELNPNFALAHFWHSIALGTLNRHEEAVAALEIALRLDPLSAHINSSWARHLKDQGQVDEAMAYYEKAIALESDYWAAYWHLAGLRHSLGRLDEAIEIYKAFIESSGDDHKKAMSHIWIADIYINDLGDYVAAQQWIVRARDLQIASNDAINMQIHLYLALDRYNQAAELTHQWAAAKLPPNFAGYAALYEMVLGHDAHARRLYEQVEAAPLAVYIEAESNLFELNDDFGYLPAVNYANLLLKANEVARGTALLQKSRAFVAETTWATGPGKDYVLSSIHAVEGNKQKAFRALRQAIDGGWHKEWFIVRDPNMYSLRDDPEFRAMLADIKNQLSSMRERVRQAEAGER